MGRPVKVEGRNWAADVATLRRIGTALRGCYGVVAGHLSQRTDKLAADLERWRPRTRPHAKTARRAKKKA